MLEGLSFVNIMLVRLFVNPKQVIPTQTTARDKSDHCTVLGCSYSSKVYFA